MNRDKLVLINRQLKYKKGESLTITTSSLSKIDQHDNFTRIYPTMQRFFMMSTPFLTFFGGIRSGPGITCGLICGSFAGLYLSLIDIIPQGHQGVTVQIVN